MSQQGAGRRGVWDAIEEAEHDEAHILVQEGYAMALRPPNSTKQRRAGRGRPRRKFYAEARATRMIQGVKIQQFYIEQGDYTAGDWHRKSGHITRSCTSWQEAVNTLAQLMQRLFVVPGCDRDLIPYVPVELYAPMCASFREQFGQELSGVIHSPTSHP